MKSLLRKILSPSLIQHLKNALGVFDRFIYPFFAKSGFLSSVYYCFFSSQFRREHRAVLLGRLKYKASLSQIKQSSVLLRRNTHRLEKGLIMEPRRPVFALGYIGDTVECYRQCLSSEEISNDELKWAYDVLTQYFNVVQTDSVITQTKKIFDQLSHRTIENEDKDKDGRSLPYQYSDRVKTNVSANELTNLFKQRRSVRWFQQRPVDNSIIEQAVTMAAQAPSACNRQPFKFHVVTNMSKASEIADVAIGTVGFSKNIPAIIVIVGDLSAYPSERDRHVIYIDGGLVAMQLMLALETLGLSTCPINWPDINLYENIMIEKLQLAPHLRPIMLLAVGYGKEDGYIPYSQKKTSDVLIEDVKC